MSKESMDFRVKCRKEFNRTKIIIRLYANRIRVGEKWLKHSLECFSLNCIYANAMLALAQQRTNGMGAVHCMSSKS